MRWLRGELSCGKLYYLAAGTLIGNGFVAIEWTRVVHFDPIIFGLGIVMVIVGWRMK